jgi:hypothetical protein
LDVSTATLSSSLLIICIYQAIKLNKKFHFNLRNPHSVKASKL